MEKENGAKEQLLQTAINTRASISLTKSLASARLRGNQGINIEVVTKMTKDTDTEKCTGLMEAATKVSGSMVFSTA